MVEVVAKGGTKATVISQDGLRFDLRVVPPECYGNLLQHFTGSKDHNVAMREEAVRRGLSISEYGVTEVESGEVHTFRTEEELYGWLGYQFIPPELRENAGELEAARRGELPELVEERDLRGDLHAHTTWSADGKSTMEEMALAAQGARLRVPRRSPTTRTTSARGGSRRRPRRSRRSNARLKPFRLLHGVEVEHPRERRARRARRGARRARLGGRVDPRGVLDGARPSACSRRWRTRTSTASAT